MKSSQMRARAGPTDGRSLADHTGCSRGYGWTPPSVQTVRATPIPTGSLSGLQPSKSTARSKANRSVMPAT